jgi:HEAT repeat protein
MKEMLTLSLLENPSASERMRAVSYVTESNDVNRKIANALLTTLNNDPNVNVRLTTLEVLSNFANDPFVRKGLVASILQQDSPLVQDALADVMVKLQEKKAVKPLQQVLKNKETNEMIKAKIRKVLPSSVNQKQKV